MWHLPEHHLRGIDMGKCEGDFAVDEFLQIIDAGVGVGK
jgi:hypothetical protein